MRVFRFELVLAALAVVLVAGCPPGTATKSEKPAAEPCRRLGQNCEFSPGKLGTCVMRDDCTGDACFVCQSQH